MPSCRRATRPLFLDPYGRCVCGPHRTGTIGDQIRDRFCFATPTSASSLVRLTSRLVRLVSISWTETFWFDEIADFDPSALAESVSTAGGSASGKVSLFGGWFVETKFDIGG